VSNSTTIVFSDRERTDPSPAGHNEPTFRFLDRVSGAYWDQVRDLIEAWIANVPAGHRADLIGRLRSTDNTNHVGAYWELYLHETFRRSGFTIAIHPDVPIGARQPDFRVARGNESYYVEAKCLISKGSDAGAASRKRRLYEALDKIHCPNFFLQIDVHSVGSADLPTKGLRRKLEAWVSTLDPDATHVDDRHEYLGERFTWAEAGWDLGFRAFPVSQAARGRVDHRPLGIFGPVEAAWINDDVTLRSALADKGSAYGPLDRPLVIAVNSFAFSHDDFDTMNALYGTEQITVSLEDRDAPPVPSRKPDGYWFDGAWAHQHVSGVLIGRSIAEYRPTAAPTFWIHPEPTEPVTALPCWRIAEPVIDHIEYREPTATMNELFDLPDVWPVGEAFPREVSA
jgi:hypothetical protein